VDRPPLGVVVEALSRTRSTRESQKARTLSGEPTRGPRALIRAAIRRDAVDLAAVRPLAADTDGVAVWGMILGDVFQHVVDATSSHTRLERQRLADQLFAALVAISRRPHVGAVESVPAGHSLPELRSGAVEVIRARRDDDRLELTLFGGWNWSQAALSQWAHLLYDLTHAAAQLESVPVGALRASLLGEIHEPTTARSGSFVERAALKT
jgi:hypothetical protein